MIHVLFLIEFFPPEPALLAHKRDAFITVYAKTTGRAVEIAQQVGLRRRRSYGAEYHTVTPI